MAAEVALGLYQHIFAEMAVLREGATGGVCKAHPLLHPMQAQALLEHRLACGQLAPVIDAGDLGEVLYYQVASVL